MKLEELEIARLKRLVIKLEARGDAVAQSHGLRALADAAAAAIWVSGKPPPTVRTCARSHLCSLPLRTFDG